MFCPKCGQQFADNAKFCPKCGHGVGDRQQKVLAPSADAPAPQAPLAPPAPANPAPMPPQGRPPQQPNYGGIQGGPSQQGPKKRSMVVPIVVGIVVLAALVGGGFLIYNTFFNHKGEFVEPQLKEEEPNRVSPKENIEVTDLKLSTDSLNRYLITGTVHNKGDQAYDVTLDLTATEHRSDKYGDEVTSTTTSLGLVSVDPYTRGSGSSITLYDLEPGERQFTCYTSWGSIENFLGEGADETECTVRSVSLPDAQPHTKFDHGFNSDGGIKDIQLNYTQDGKLRGSFVNDTGMYLNEVKITYVAKNKEGLPAVKGRDARPYGAVVDSLSVDTLRPGETGEFEVNVGEGFESIDPLDVQITPDPQKSKIN